MTSPEHSFPRKNLPAPIFHHYEVRFAWEFLCQKQLIQISKKKKNISHNLRRRNLSLSLYFCPRKTGRFPYSSDHKSSSHSWKPWSALVDCSRCSVECDSNPLKRECRPKKVKQKQQRFFVVLLCAQRMTKVTNFAAKQRYFREQHGYTLILILK